MSDKKGDSPKENPAKSISVPPLPTKETRGDDGDTRPQGFTRNEVEYRSK